MTPTEALGAAVSGHLKGVPIEIRLWGRCEIVGDCWEYGGGTSAGGYGQIHWRGKSWRAHRVAYTLAKGDIPSGLDVLHGCDNPPCVNPDHLRVGTDSDNIRDSFERGRRNVVPSIRNLTQVVERQRAATHCARSHEWTPENTAYRQDGTRRCRACGVENHRKWRRAYRFGGGPCTICTTHTNNHHGRNGVRYCSATCKTVGQSAGWKRTAVAA